MAMETCLAMAVAMGRTLVLPPEQGMYLLHKVRCSIRCQKFLPTYFLPLSSFTHSLVPFMALM